MLNLKLIFAGVADFMLIMKPFEKRYVSNI